jgi:DNA-binding response OmpR family regulator
MSKTVLLIESDPKFAREMSAALESRGFGVRTSSDGKEGVELARALRPDCVVLCVELPGLSGYSWCNRLKKDDVLKAIPLVITSSEATPETFEQHRKLKTRAEDYLIKPFQPATLVERVGALVGMPDAPAADDEELITLADVELDGAGGATALEEDADLKMLDDAFDSISGGGGDEPSTRAPGAPVSEPPLTLLPDADESPAILDLDREMAEALASLAEEAAAPAPARGSPLATRRPPKNVRLV